jgi:RHS repeat-associated protein
MVQGIVIIDMCRVRLRGTPIPRQPPSPLSLTPDRPATAPSLPDTTRPRPLLREYIWNRLTPVAVIEGGAVCFIRTDHIGKPVFATDSLGTKVWQVSYDPFGGVLASTGTPNTIRFPGQWFQSVSGLHQNWMRDYEPTTGWFLQTDPLGFVDGASVYGYARQNPGRWIDPTGEFVWAVLGSVAFGFALDMIIAMVAILWNS